MTTQAEYFQTHQVDGQLSDAQMVELLKLPEGESGMTPQSGEPVPTPAPTAAPVATAEPPAPTPEPVILAKDGVHTIPFEKLTEAREGERVAKTQVEATAAENERLRQENEALKRGTQPTPEPTIAPVAEDDAPDFGDFSDADLKKAFSKMVADRVAPLKAELDRVNETLSKGEQKQIETEATKHWTALYTAHPNMDSMLDSKELEAWIAAQPFYAQPGIRAVIDGGTTDQVVQVFDSFVEATTGKKRETTGAPAGDDVASRAAAALAKAASRAPSSLSEVPGSGANHDEAAAMLEMTTAQQMKMFDGKSPDQIHALMSKIV